MLDKTRHGFERTLAPHMDELYGAAFRLTRNECDADDVLQEAMTRAWAFWGRFEEGTNARAWMHRILFNTFVNGYRRKKREREILGRVHRETHAEPPVAPPGPGLGDEVTVALDALPEVFREVILLVDLRGHAYKDAAKMLDCPVGTVMSRLHRGRRILKQRLREYAASEGYIPMAA